MQEAGSKNPLVRVYYSQRAFMGFCCISCEVLYLSIYAVCHPLAPKRTFLAPKPMLAVVQWTTGCVGAKYADFLPTALICVALVGCATKQVVNAHQLVGAMQRLAALEKKTD
jgi:CDP-diacylglycerol--inositol 3-phosphatidyltransferase